MAKKIETPSSIEEEQATSTSIVDEEPSSDIEEQEIEDKSELKGEQVLKEETPSPFELDLSEVPEELHDAVRKNVEEILKGYRRAWTRKTQELAEERKLAQFVNSLAQQMGYENFYDFYNDFIANPQNFYPPQRKEIVDEDVVEEEESDEVKKLKEIEERQANVEALLLQQEKLRAVEEWKTQHPDWTKYVDKMLPIVERLDNILPDKEVLDIAYAVATKDDIYQKGYNDAILKLRKKVPYTEGRTSSTEGVITAPSPADIIRARLKEAIKKSQL